MIWWWYLWVLFLIEWWTYWICITFFVLFIRWLLLLLFILGLLFQRCCLNYLTDKLGKCRILYNLRIFRYPKRIINLHMSLISNLNCTLHLTTSRNALRIRIISNHHILSDSITPTPTTIIPNPNRINTIFLS